MSAGAELLTGLESPSTLPPHAASASERQKVAPRVRSDVTFVQKTLMLITRCGSPARLVLRIPFRISFVPVQRTKEVVSDSEGLALGAKLQLTAAASKTETRIIIS